MAEPDRPAQEGRFEYPRRDLWAAARDALVWLSGPVSERGASRGSRLSIHMGASSRFRGPSTLVDALGVASA
jgi:hypothetical protein